MVKNMIKIWLFLSSSLGVRRPLRTLVEHFQLDIVDAQGNTGADRATDFSPIMKSKMRPLIERLANSKHSDVVFMWVTVGRLRRIVFVDEHVDRIRPFSSFVAVASVEGVLVCTINVFARKLENSCPEDKFLRVVDTAISEACSRTQINAFDDYISKTMFDGESENYRRLVIDGVRHANSFIVKVAQLHSAGKTVRGVLSQDTAFWTFEYMSSRILKEDGDPDAVLSKTEKIPVTKERIIDSSGKFVLAEKLFSRRIFNVIVGDTFPSRAKDDITFGYPLNLDARAHVKGALAQHITHQWKPLMDIMRKSEAREFVVCSELRFRKRRVPVVVSADRNTVYIDTTMVFDSGLSGDSADGIHAFDYHMRYVQAVMLQHVLMPASPSDGHPWRELPAETARALRPRWRWNDKMPDVVSLYAALKTRTLAALVRADSANGALRSNLAFLFSTMKAASRGEHVQMLHAWKSNAAYAQIPLLTALLGTAPAKTTTPIESGNDITMRCLPFP